jgi:tetraacyldisaccharide 4'-kinase
LKRFRNPADNFPHGKFYRRWDVLINRDRKSLWQSILLQILLLLSMVYERLVRLNRACAGGRGKRLNGKVISVGNLTLGGTGKTPLVEYLARWLRDEGRKVAILSRGYGGGDEPLMLSRKNPGLPVIVGRDRYSAGRKAEGEIDIDSFIMDDGFQHMRLARDLEIVALDAVSPFGNGYLLPRGNLRVPADFLKYADIAVLTGAEQAQDRLNRLRGKILRMNPGLLIIEASYQPEGLHYLGSEQAVPLAELADKPVGLLCGIGNPLSFRSTVKGLKAEIIKEFFFMDHYRFKEKDIIETVESSMEKGVRWLITTEKDEVRFPDMKKTAGEPGIPILVLEVSVRLLRGEKELKEKVREALKENV